MMQKSLILVCDDAGFASTDRGIRILASESGLPMSAEYMIEQDGAPERAREMGKFALVERGLHFELSGISDAERVRMAKALQARGTCLGELEDIREKAIDDARRQLELFRMTQDVDPTHVSTHGNFNTEPDGKVAPWWYDLMDELFGGDIPPMQIDIPHVRHNLYSWNLPGTARMPRSETEFAEELRKVKDKTVVEFVMHPALARQGDADINMLFDVKMRRRDFWSALHILRSGVIQEAGFKIVPVTALTRSRTTVLLTS